MNDEAVLLKHCITAVATIFIVLLLVIAYTNKIGAEHMSEDMKVCIESNHDWVLSTSRPGEYECKGK